MASCQASSGSNEIKILVVIDKYRIADIWSVRGASATIATRIQDEPPRSLNLGFQTFNRDQSFVLAP